MNENSIAWLRANARKLNCPSCEGKIRPKLLEPSLVQCPMICLKCKRVWIYSINITTEVNKRVARCKYSSEQPFL